MAKIKSPTNVTTGLILQYLFSVGVFAWRENVLPVPMVRRGLLTGFRGGSKQGKPDIMGIIPPGLLPGNGLIYGIPLGVEVKTGPDKLRPEQIGFQKTATRVGAVILTVKDFADFKRQWKKLCINSLQK